VGDEVSGRKGEKEKRRGGEKGRGRLGQNGESIESPPVSITIT